MNEQQVDLPPSVECWALKSKWLVDKFHFSTHVGAMLFSSKIVAIRMVVAVLQCPFLTGHML